MTFPLSFFESEEATCFDIIKALYSVTDSELEVLVCVNINKPVSIKRLTELIPKDRATIARGLQRLMSIGIVKKEKRNLERGGYVYLYSSLSMDELRERLHGLIDRIGIRMNEAISALSEEKCEIIYHEVLERYQS